MFMPGFSQPQQFFTAWSQAAKEHLGRLEALQAQLHKQQGQNVERACEAIDESAKLMRESLTYSQTLAVEWQKLGVESLKQSIDMMKSQGV